MYVYKSYVYIIYIYIFYLLSIIFSREDGVGFSINTVLSILFLSRGKNLTAVF
jgi:hypothetical protein